MGKVRVAIIAVRNCASSLIHGVKFYWNARDDEFVPGLMHARLGGYHNYVRMEGTNLGNVPLNLACKLEAWDSPNSAGVVIDAVRCARMGLDRGLKGALEAPSSYFMESPPVQFSDDQAREIVEKYIAAQ